MSGWNRIPGRNVPTLLFALGSVTGMFVMACTGYLHSIFHNLVLSLTKDKNLLNVSHHCDYKGDTSFTIYRIQKSLELSRTMLHQLVRIFLRDLERGLESNSGTMKCIPTQITTLPTGNEQGTYLAFVLGGSSYRIAIVTLLGKGRTKFHQVKSELPETIKTETSEVLFDFCAKMILEFYEDLSIDKSTPMKMGFTFSFPVKHDSVSDGTLLMWTKGFDIDDTVGQSVRDLFAKSLEKLNLNIEICALINDSVSIFLSSAYSDDSTQMGVVLGTGNNASYVESTKLIGKLADASTKEEDKMVINLEWGGWGSDGSILPTTVYDVKVDRESYNPRMQGYEKMISGMYLGEVCRHIIIDLISTGELFHGRSYARLTKPQSFTVVHMSRIERDYSPDLTATRNLLEDFYEIKNPTLSDLKLIRKVCELVSTRAARVASVGIAATLTKLKKIGGCGVTVAINGSVFEHYPHFKNRMKDTFRELFGVAEEEILLTQSVDGPIIGAAIAVAMNNPSPISSNLAITFREPV